MVKDGLDTSVRARMDIFSPGETSVARTQTSCFRLTALVATLQIYHQTNRQENKQTSTQANKQTNRQPNNQTTKQPNKQTSKQPN